MPQTDKPHLDELLEALSEEERADFVNQLQEDLDASMKEVRDNTVHSLDHVREAFGLKDKE